MRTAARRWALGACLLALGLSSVACVETNKPDGGACSAMVIELDLTLFLDALSPSDPAVCMDQRVTLRVQSDVDGVVHIHGYDEEMPGLEVREGVSTQVAFTASRTGQFPVELHTEGSAEGTAIGVFTVHVP